MPGISVACCHHMPPDSAGTAIIISGSDENAGPCSAAAPSWLPEGSGHGPSRSSGLGALSVTCTTTS
eukprot:2173766-Rhodomonas_salina.4